MLAKKPFYNMNISDDTFRELYGETSAYQKKRYENAYNKFCETFNADSAYICSSSGRVELLGNHTDHNGGRVMSCAISLDTLAFFLPNNSRNINLLSEGYGKITIDLDDLSDTEKGTTKALIKGVAKWFIDNGFSVGGFDAYVISTVLNGAGISSSAAFEVLISEIFNFLFNDEKVTCEQKVKAAHFAENVYFGKPCGMLDQTAIAYGGLKKLDFADKNRIKVDNVEGNLDDYTLILVNTGGSHENLTDEYAAIPAEMKLVAKAFGKERLVEINENEFYNADKLKNLPDRAITRTIHFFEENKRVDNAEKALNAGDYASFLTCVKESGISSLCKLQNCYVSGSKEQPIPKALSVAERFLNGGANRVHGGGFAGTILNIVKNNDAEQFIENTSKFFGKENVIKLKVRKIGTKVL